MKKKRKVTIAELERILESDDSPPIHILPDGSITTDRRRKKDAKVKILTLDEALGGNYLMARFFRQVVHQRRVPRTRWTNPRSASTMVLTLSCGHGVFRPQRSARWKRVACPYFDHAEYAAWLSKQDAA